jgi:Insertion element 4 transposase N-terminal
MMTFCHPVVTVPATVRGGVVLADGWLPDFVRLGELERHIGDGVIEALVEKAVTEGWLAAQQRRRIMSFPLLMRLVVAMTLMPDASYAETITRLAGHLADVPWARDWHVPASRTVTTWRDKLPACLMEELFWAVAGPLADDGAPSAVLLAGLPVCGIDGMLISLADTPANRVMSGCSGSAARNGYGQAPFPQLQAVVVTARAGRAALGAITGGARAGEQTLLARLIRRRRELFRGRVFCFDRNFPGHDIIAAIIDAGGHAVARVKDTSPAPPVLAGGWLPDGSRMSYLNAPGGKTAGRLPVRVTEHNAVLPCGDGEQVSETYTLITTLLDHTAASAEAIRQAYLTRWAACETTFGQDKTTITGAGNRTSGPVLRSGSPRLVIQEFWAWLTGTQLVRASAAASLASDEAAARALRRRAASGLTTDAVSFTASRHKAIRLMIQAKVTATTSLPQLTALADATARSVLHSLIVTGRQRHSVRQKARPKFPHTCATKPTVTGVPQITRFAPGAT